MVVLEAMASGVPVIANRVEGVPEAVDHGLTGVLAEPGCPQDLARCFQLVLSGPSTGCSCAKTGSEDIPKPSRIKPWRKAWLQSIVACSRAGKTAKGLRQKKVTVETPRRASDRQLKESYL